MSVTTNHVAHHAASTVPFPSTGGTTSKSKTTENAPEKRVSAEEKAEKAIRDDAASGARRSERGGQETRVVRRRVRRRRVSTAQTQPNYGTSKTEQAKQTKQAKAQAKAEQGGHTSQSSNAHMMRKMNSQSSLNKMTAQFQSGQMGGGPQTPVGKKMAMLGNLQNYMKNDYAAMKANDQDTSFTYRTSEARQLVATLGTMAASATKTTTKKDTKSSGGESKTLTPAAFGRQKGLLRELKAMSDPHMPLPEGLPPDYKPFESGA